MGQIQSQSKNIFVGQIQPWSDIVCIYWSHTTEVCNYIYRSNTTLVFVTRPKIDTKNKLFVSEINFSDTEAGPFFSIPKILDPKVYPSSQIAAK